MEQDERMERLAAQIASEENSEEGVGFVVRVEQLIPQYREQYAEYVQEHRDEDSGPLGPVRLWAHDMTGQLDASRFPTLYELKRHVYAMGKLAGLSVQQC
eukprot:5949474-Karenia_brevis.AAC.1